MAYRSSSETHGAAVAGEITATAPSGVQANDRLVAMVSIDSTNVTAITCSGWTSLGSYHQTGPDGIHTQFLEKTATGSDLYVFSANATSYQNFTAQVFAFSGRALSTASAITISSNGTGNASPISIALNSVTSTENDDLVVFYALDIVGANDVWTFSTLSNFTDAQYVHGLAYTCAGSQYRENVSAGSTGTLTVTATRSSGSSNSGWGGAIIAIPSSNSSVLLPPDSLMLMGYGV